MNTPNVHAGRLERRVAMKVRTPRHEKPPAAETAFFSDYHRPVSGRLGQVAEFLQLPDPARCVAIDHKRIVVDRGVFVRYFT